MSHRLIDSQTHRRAHMTIARPMGHRSDEVLREVERDLIPCFREAQCKPAFSGVAFSMHGAEEWHFVGAHTPSLWKCKAHVHRVPYVAVLGFEEARRHGGKVA